MLLGVDSELDSTLYVDTRMALAASFPAVVADAEKSFRDLHGNIEVLGIYQRDQHAPVAGSHWTTCLTHSPPCD